MASIIYGPELFLYLIRTLFFCCFHKPILKSITIKLWKIIDDMLEESSNFRGRITLQLTSFFCLDSAALLFWNQHQIYLFGQILSGQIGGQPYIDISPYSELSLAWDSSLGWRLRSADESIWQWSFFHLILLELNFDECGSFPAHRFLKFINSLKARSDGLRKTQSCSLLNCACKKCSKLENSLFHCVLRSPSECTFNLSTRSVCDFFSFKFTIFILSSKPTKTWMTNRSLASRLRVVPVDVAASNHHDAARASGQRAAIGSTQPEKKCFSTKSLEKTTMRLGHRQLLLKLN